MVLRSTRRWYPILLTVLFSALMPISLAAEGRFVGCFPRDESSGEPVPDLLVEQLNPSLGTGGTGRPPYLRNTDAECVLVSDVNLKMSAGLTFRNARDPIYVMLELMDCMHGAGCYIPHRGVLDTEACFEQLCRCNKAIVKESIRCSGSTGFDCKQIKKALESRGGAELWVVKNGMGHAVQVTYLDCANNVGKMRDPNDPSKEDVFRVDSEGTLHTGTNPMMNGSSVYGSYSVSR